MSSVLKDGPHETCGNAMSHRVMPCRPYRGGRDAGGRARQRAVATGVVAERERSEPVAGVRLVARVDGLPTRRRWQAGAPAQTAGSR
jgi:hypothetical protein